MTTGSRQDRHFKKGCLSKRKVVFFLLIFAAAVLAVAVFFIVSSNQQTNSDDKAFSQALQSFAPAQTSVPIATGPASASASPENTLDQHRKKPDRNIDFSGLAAKNGDIFAWINIPGTEIDYPVVHGKDNEYYLSHDAFKKESQIGAIFSDMSNTKGNVDPVTVLYGHRMNSGSMFAQLHKYEDKSFFEKNNTVKIYTLEGQWNYEVFAAYKTDNSNILYGKNFKDKQVLQEYLDGIKNVRDINAHISSTNVTVDDYILTLSTCVKGEEDDRYVVQAVLR
jgi:sortase, SrtB family